MSQNKIFSSLQEKKQNNKMIKMDNMLKQTSFSSAFPPSYDLNFWPASLIFLSFSFVNSFISIFVTVASKKEYFLSLLLNSPWFPFYTTKKNTSDYILSLAKDE